MQDPLSFRFEGGINPQHAEDFILRLGEDEVPTRKVCVEFKGYPYVAPGAGWRIGNALRRYRDQALEVIVPPVLQGEWFRTFTRSGIGDAIAAHAYKVFSEDTDVTEQVRKYYRDNCVRSSPVSAFFGGVHHGLVIDPNREDRFRSAIADCLNSNQVSKSARLADDSFESLVKLLFEAVQNVYDHAAKTPFVGGLYGQVVSYMSFAYYKQLGPHPDVTGSLQSYLKRLADIFPGKDPAFLHFCINDDGNGIVARQSLDASVYWKSFDDELQRFREALQYSSSVKLRALDSRVRGTPGAGYTYIEAGLRTLTAFGILRTGRVAAIFDATNQALPGFSPIHASLGVMPGTTLDVLIPVISPQQNFDF